MQLVVKDLSVPHFSAPLWGNSVRLCDTPLRASLQCVFTLKHVSVPLGDATLVMRLHRRSLFGLQAAED